VELTPNHRQIDSRQSPESFETQSQPAIDGHALLIIFSPPEGIIGPLDPI
jgi:hypothetical protein